MLGKWMLSLSVYCDAKPSPDCWAQVHDVRSGRIIDLDEQILIFHCELEAGFTQSYKVHVSQAALSQGF